MKTEKPNIVAINYALSGNGYIAIHYPELINLEAEDLNDIEEITNFFLIRVARMRRMKEQINLFSEEKNG